ncbi:MAG TPA: hypothetical protein VEQ85_14765, partial [Lacipirellulaceae bacterium]|nr:hypothetical protein [Lacipirellulaceae bacterium]
MLRRCIRLLSPWAVVVCATHALAQHQPAVQPEQPPLTVDQPAAPLPGSAAAGGVSPNYGQPAAGAPAYGAQAAPPAYGQPAQGAAAALAQPMAPAATTP